MPRAKHALPPRNGRLVKKERGPTMLASPPPPLRSPPSPLASPKLESPGAQHALPFFRGRLRKRPPTPPHSPPLLLPPEPRWPRAEHALPPLNGKLRKRPPTPPLSPPSPPPEPKAFRAKHALPPCFGRLRKKRRSPPSPIENVRPPNVDVPDAVLPPRYKRYGVVIKEVDIGVDKIEESSSGSSRSSSSSPSQRPSSEFPMRKDAKYVGSKTPRFYIESMRNLPGSLLQRTKGDSQASYSRRRSGFLARMVGDWMRKRRRRRWIEVRRDNDEDMRIFRHLFPLIDNRYRGGELFYREESIETYVFYRVKFKHFFRGTVEVLERSLELAADEMQYELEFEDVNRSNKVFEKLFTLLQRYPKARVLWKIDRYGRRHVKVEHEICGFRVCGRTLEDAIASLCDLYMYDIAVRGDRKMKRWHEIFDAMELYYSESKLFYKQVDDGYWDAKVIHEVEGVKARGRGCTLDIALDQVRNGLEIEVELLQDRHLTVDRWRC